MSGKKILRLAAVQAAPVWLNHDATVEKACDFIQQAGDAGADIVGFPENFIPGHPLWYYFYPATSPKSMQLAARLFHNSMEIPGPATDLLCQAAARAGVFVVMGVTERVPGTTGTLYNTQLFIDGSGRIVGKHQKIAPTIGERLVHVGGRPETQRTFPSEFGQISGLVCGENSNPFAVAMITSNYPIVHVASWPNFFIPSGIGMQSSTLLVSQNIAYMCKCFVISSNGVNSEEMIADLAATEADEVFLRTLDRTGGTCIIDPTARIIAGRMPGGEEGLIYADADLEACVNARLVHDFGGHYNRADVYRLLVDNTPADLVTSFQRTEEHTEAMISAPRAHAVAYAQGVPLPAEEPLQLSAPSA